MDLSSSARGQERRGGNGVIERGETAVTPESKYVRSWVMGRVALIRWFGEVEIAQSNDARLLLMIYSSPT